MDAQKKQLIDAMTQFIERVIAGNANNEAEIQILPEIIHELRLLAFED